MRLVFISDTHLRHAFSIPEGDVLVHCGDFTMRGSASEISRFDQWQQTLKSKFRYTVIIAGNHEIGFEETPEAAQRLLKTPRYLQDSSIVIEGVKFYGSPWQPWFYDWAFNFPEGSEGRRVARETWAKIPDDTDVLVTHGPPYGILDRNLQREHCGDRDLPFALKRVKPRIHAFGHIHCAHGSMRHPGYGDTLFVNACICDEAYMPTQAPIVVDLFPTGVVIV